MTILAGDIKLVASSVMDDIDEGGGEPTSTVITDGDSNSVFNDISELDRAGGRVNLRKVFAHVQTDNTDTYLGGNVIVAETPADPNVSITIFEADSAFDVRSDAQGRIEAYLNKSSTWSGFLYENHVKGQRAIQIFQRESSDLPVVGHTFCLVANEGDSDEYYQYVRVTAVSTETRTFSYTNSGSYIDYTANVVTCSLSDSLRYDFTGTSANRLYQADSGAAIIRDTLVADAAEYYGASATKSAVAIGDYSATVESIYTKVVPSTQSETALTDKNAANSTSPMVATSASTVTTEKTITVAAGGSYYTPTGIYPGSLSLTIGGKAFSDDGAGTLLYLGGEVGSVDYENGKIVFNSSTSASGACTETYQPAAAVSMQSYSLQRQVTQETRAYVWVASLSPLPAPGSLVVSYMAQGNWYSISDDGTGKLSGADTAYGVGTVSYTTGTCAITLGSLPDVGTSVIFSWGTPQTSVYLSDTALSVSNPKIEFDFGETVVPGSLTMTWLSNGVTKTATDDGNGTLSGDASGEIYYGSGTGYLRANPLPDATAISASYDTTGGSEVFGATTAGGTTWSGTIPETPVKPKSVLITFQTANTYSASNTVGASTIEETTISTNTANVRDDGSGGLYLVGYGTLPGSTINYTTGEIVMGVSIASYQKVPQYSSATSYVSASD